jgi:four helix bundle protein
MKSYNDLEVYSLGLELFYKCYSYLLKLSKYEMFELGSYLRKSADSITTNIVE